jgi:hypothetical protein
VLEPIFPAIMQEMGHVEQRLELLEGLSFAGSNSRHESGSKLAPNEVGFVLFADSPIHLGWINVVTLEVK